MATIIDALLVTLGIDSSDFDRKRKTADEDFRKTRTNADTYAKDIAESGKKASNFFTHLRTQALEFFAAIAGSRDLLGFAAHVTQTDAAIGRLSQRTGMSVQAISRFQNMVQEMGGTAGEANSTLGDLADRLARFKLGDASGVLGLNMLGVGVNPNQSIDQLLDKIHARVQVLQAQGRPSNVITSMLAQAGISGSMTNLMESSNADYAAASKRGEQNAINPRDVKAAQDLQRTFADIQQSLFKLGSDLLHTFAPGIERAINALNNWIVANRPLIEEGIDKAVKQVITWLQGVDWTGLGSQMTAFANAADQVAKALGGWQNVIEGLVALWGASKVVSMFSGILGLARVLGVGAVGTAATFTGAVLAGGGASKVVSMFSGILGLARVLGVGAVETTATFTGAVLAGGTTSILVAGLAAAALMSGKTGEAPNMMTPGGQRQSFGRLAPVIDALRKAGYSEAGIAGIAGNLTAESGGDPNAKNGDHWGLAQWSPERRAVIMAAQGVSNWNQVDQTKALLWELGPEGPYKYIGDALQQTTDPGQAAIIDDELHEKPGNYAVNNAVRMAYAQRIFNNAYGNLPRTGASANTQALTVSHKSTHQETNVNGPITINTKAQDAKGIARALKTSLNNRVNSFNYGLA